MTNKRLEAGLKHINNNKGLLLLLILYIALMVIVWNLLNYTLTLMGTPFSSLFYRVVLCVLIGVLLVVGEIAIIQALGRPASYKKVEKALGDIGLIDSLDSAPMFLSKKKDGKGFILEFYSPLISIKQYRNKIQEIETALNVRVFDITEGIDPQHIIIRVYKGTAFKDNVLIWNDSYLSNKDFEFVLGENVFEQESVNLVNTPHLLIGGATSSGKTNLLKLILYQALLKNAEVYIADFKGGVDYPMDWRSSCSIITTPEDFNEQLDTVILTLEERKELFYKSMVRNISEYNKNPKNTPRIERIIVACDEVAEVLDKTGLDKQDKETISQIESKLSTIARQGRAFGIHLILSTQRPSADVINGQIKNNISFRICGKADSVLSQIILDSSEASERIPSDGVGLFLTSNGLVFKAYYLEE